MMNPLVCACDRLSSETVAVFARHLGDKFHLNRRAISEQAGAPPAARGPVAGILCSFSTGAASRGIRGNQETIDRDYCDYFGENVSWNVNGYLRRA